MTFGKICLLGFGVLLAIGLMTSDFASAQAPGKKPYRHVVLFSFKGDSPKEKVDDIVEAFKALPKKLPSIKAFEWGTNVSPEGINQGFTHCFTLTFENKEALEKGYLHEPAHKEFGSLLKGVIDKVLVVDYVVE